MVKTITSNFALFTVVLASLCFCDIVKAQSQLVTLYRDFNQVGANLTILPNQPVTNLSTYSFNNVAKSVCVTGIWMFYEMEHYNPGLTNDGLEYYFGNNSCFNFVQNVNRVSSLRFAGHPDDYKRSGVTFYTRKYFQGRETYIEQDAGDIDTEYRSGSFVITGNTNEGWTFYDQPYYRGNSTCVFPPATCVAYEPAFIYDVELLGLPNNSIRSVMKGCDSRNAKAKTY